MNNRLQFRHHNEVFATREAAIEYIQSQIRFATEGLAADDNRLGYSLLAEPTVLLYKNEEDETNPHVIITIGSVTNEGTQYSENKFCIIDIDKTEQEIADLEEELAAAIKSLTLITKDTDTLKLYAEKTEEGTYVSGDVKVAESYIFDDVRKNNNLMVTPEGLFLYVNLTYDENTEIFTFTVNNADGTLSETSVKLPNNYVTSGYYSVQDQSIHLNMRESDEVVIDCTYLIAEWDVEGEDSKSPIVLTKEEIDFDIDDNSRLKPWQDVLRADIRIKDESFDPVTGKPVYDPESLNILRRTPDKKYLYVDGKASNIVYYMDGQKSNVKKALDKLGKIKLSGDYSNILQEKTDGFFASAKLNYISKENTLVFKVSNQEETRIKLNSFRLFENVYYDSTKEALIITYIDGNDELQIVEIPIGPILTEWIVFNEGHNVLLDKSEHSIEGKDVLTADVKIHNGDNNILEDKDHTLYVNGIANNIKYDATGETTVKNVLDTLKSEEERIEGKLDDEIARAEAEEQRIDAKLDQEIADRIADVDEEQARAEAAEEVLTDKIGTGFTTDPHDNVTYKFETLQAQVNSEAEKLQAEIDRSKAKDTEHDGRLDAIDAEIGDGFGPRNTVRDEFDKEKAEREAADAELQSEIDVVSADSSSRLSDVINEDESIDVETRADAAGKPTVKVVKVNLSTEVEDEKPNIIKLNADGLYAGVDLSYEETANKLIFKTTNGTKEIQLESMSSIISIEYNPSKEAIVITYMTNGHEIKTVEIPVGDLIREWKPSESTDGAIKLTLTEAPSGTTAKDILYGEVLISDHPDNILINDGGRLYVSNADITANTAAIETLEGRMDTAEADIDTLENNLREEVSARTLADDALGARIDQEIADRIADVNAEENRAISAETALSNKIDADVLAERNRAVSAETALDTKIGQEIADRIADVNAEESRATTEEARIEHLLNDEISRSTTKDTEHDTKIAQNSSDIADEVTRAKAAENVISGNVISEETRAKAVEETIKSTLSAETADRISGDTMILHLINDEENRAKSAESGLSGDIAAEEARAREIETRLETWINQEIARAEAAESELNTAITNETIRANSADTELYQSIADEKVERADADNSLNSKIVSAATNLENKILVEKARAEAIELELQNSIGVEETRAKNKENTLETSLTNEVTRATDAEAAIQAQVNANKLEFHDTTTIDLVRTGTNPSEVVGHVKIATADNNIIKVSDSSYGIYASVDLSYDKATNTLTFEASDGTNKTIELSSGSVFTDAWFDSATEELVLMFINPDGTPKYIRIPVGDLFNQWGVDNTNSWGIELFKTPGTGSGSTDLLSAKVKISQTDDNILVLKDNNLYVSGSGVTKALADSETISGNLETLRTAVNGTSEGYSYPNHVASHIISAATSYDEADMLLDEQLSALLRMNVSAITCSNKSEWVEDGANKKLQVYTRLSHGNLAEMPSDKLIITGFTGDYIDPTTTEFTDTNVLRVICLDVDPSGTTPSIDSKQNGIYLSNTWDCGLYYGTTEEDRQAKANAEAAGYIVDLYNTDESSGASNYNYMNNVRQ